MTNIIYCDYCGWKKITKDFSDLGEIKEINNHSTDDNKNRKFRCPSCGRLVKSRQALDPQKDVDLKLKKESQKEQMKSWTQEILKYREEFEKDE